MSNCIIANRANDDESGDSQYCYTPFHLKCIKSWASKSVKDMQDAYRTRGETGKEGDWRCPGCQRKRLQVPPSYLLVTLLFPLAYIELKKNQKNLDVSVVQPRIHDPLGLRHLIVVGIHVLAGELAPIHVLFCVTRDLVRHVKSRYSYFAIALDRQNHSDVVRYYPERVSHVDVYVIEFLIVVDIVVFPLVIPEIVQIAL